MRVLAFSDLHRDQFAAENIVAASAPAEVVIGAGDFAIKGVGAIETLSILKRCSVPVVLVHGNHDDPEDIARYCEGWENGHYLHGTSVTIGGQDFFGLGGEVPSRNAFEWNASESEADATRLLRTCPRNAILVTHTPPFAIVDLQRDGTHEGSTAILDGAITRTPRLLLCGHIHHAWGMAGQIGETKVHNLGPTVNWFEV